MNDKPLVEINAGARDIQYVNFSNPFLVTDNDGNATDGRRINLTSSEGKARVNVTMSVAEMLNMAEQAQDECADTINFSFTIERSDTGKPCKQIAKMIAKRKVRASRLVTRLGGFFYKK